MPWGLFSPSPALLEYIINQHGTSNQVKRPLIF
nr:MAG TPA: hypothetical protein [Caudoviricetes sp.]